MLPMRGIACGRPRLSSARFHPRSDWRYSLPVNREQLLDLTERVRLVAGVELPVIVGSQSLYGVTPHVPDIVKRSVECDFLLLAVGHPVFRAVIEQIGFASNFQETHGYYADAVGLATVVLPKRNCAFAGNSPSVSPITVSEERCPAQGGVEDGLG